MKRYNNLPVVGIDHGYGNNKTANTVTPTGITKLDAAPTFIKQTLCFDDALIEGLERNQNFFSLLLNDEEIKREILGIFTEGIYNSCLS